MNVLRAPNNYDVDEASLEDGLECLDKSLAIQSQRDESDINTIVKRFGLTGELPLSQRIPLQVDIDELLDYRTCLDRVKAAQLSFASLPAAVRSTFNNDAGAFVDFAEKPENIGQLREWGLAPPAPVEPGPDPAPV